MANPLENIKNRTDLLLYNIIVRPFLPPEKRAPELTKEEKAELKIGNADDLFSHLRGLLAGHETRYIRSLYGGNPALSRLQASPSIWELMDEEGVKTGENLLMIFAVDLFQASTQVAEILVPEVRHQQGHRVPPFLRQRGKQEFPRTAAGLENFSIADHHYFGFQTLHRFHGETINEAEGLTVGILRLHEVDIALPELESQFKARLRHLSQAEKQEFLHSDAVVGAWGDVPFVRYKLPLWRRFGDIPDAGLMVKAYAVGPVDQRILFFDDVEKPERPSRSLKLPKLHILPTNRNEVTIYAVPGSVAVGEIDKDNYPHIMMPVFIGASPEAVDFFSPREG